MTGGDSNLHLDNLNVNSILHARSTKIHPVILRLNVKKEEKPMISDSEPKKPWRTQK